MSQSSFAKLGRRIVVTGLGAVTPNGNDYESTWKSVLAGESAIGPITQFDASELNTRFGGEVKNFDVTQFMSGKEAKKFDRFVHLGVAAAQQAVADAKLEINDDNAHRVGVAMGSGVGGLTNIENTVVKIEKAGTRRVSPFFIPSMIVNMVAGQYSIQSGAKGPNLSTVTACTTGAHNIGLSARLIAWGDADVMIAGGSEAAICRAAIAGFCSARALSTRNDEPTKASRPFDKNRDGFVFAEGAAMLVLEEYEHAKARGATIYAELTGVGMSGDAHHVTSPPADGNGAMRCMQAAIKDSGLSPDEINYINAHGTSTPAGDVGETLAVKAVFGENTKTPVSSTKSVTGHLLGAAGSIEAIFSVLAIRDQIAPPTINLEEPDEGCDLDYVADGARKMEINHVLSNSFGFGGTNGSLIFSKL